MNDCNFPLIEYRKSDSPYQWGLSHGEEFKTSIKELIEIRKELMLQKNPGIEASLDKLAKLQWEFTGELDQEILQEMDGIRKSSDVSITDIVILNNYTDFRDIILPDEGCSTIYTKVNNLALTGQTWDMHGSAKNYVSTIKVPRKNDNPSAIIFSLVGCVGMAGFNSTGLFLGVNNINTDKAETGVIWPALVRNALKEKNHQDLVNKLRSSKVTSGHNYLVSSVNEGQHWEVAPFAGQKVASIESGQEGSAIHTNHCLGSEITPFEDKNSISSTTKIRYEILERRTKEINVHQDLINLLQDHENYPMSICSHYESGAQDPSYTCGGISGDITSGDFFLWRGCPVHDKNYKKYNFSLSNKEFTTEE